MISVASDCLFFEMTTGESIPFSAEMISVELTGDDVGVFDPEFIKHATGAVFHYFKQELGRHTITIAEFAGALERVLRGFEFKMGASPPQPSADPAVLESDLRRLAAEPGICCELFFFPRLRDELRHQLGRAPRVVRFRGLRGCVKQLAGAQRWCGRCRTMHEQVVDYLRNCFTREAPGKECALLVD